MNKRLFLGTGDAVIIRAPVTLPEKVTARTAEFLAQAAKELPCDQ